MIVRVSLVGLARATFHGALSSLDGIDCLEQYFMNLGKMSTIAHPHSSLLARPAQLFRARVDEKSSGVNSLLLIIAELQDAS